ncbi:MAG: YegS/Rv2252/BmrU family lipid kinase [Eubacteriales bacterium]|nr:YegS/Rv2252/BmrU family lipid kinase [Eubacteriales bacterium]
MDVMYIVNPKSGKGSIRGKLLDIIDIFVKADYNLTIYISQHAGDARAKAGKEAGNVDVIICSGGDGTMDEVISGVMDSEKKCAVGYIPSGSTNDFANSLKLPKNVITAAQRIVEHNEFLCDIGEFNDDFFVYIAAFGLFTDVSYETPQDMKNVLGHLAYILEGMKKLAAIKTYHLNARIDGEEISGDFLYGMITNSTSVGGFKNITGKHVKLDDGVFEVTLIRAPQNIVELNTIIGALLTQTPDETYMYQVRAKNIEIDFDSEVSWTLDGEYGGEHQHVKIRNNEKALTLLV